MSENEQVAQYYDRESGREWHRLEKDAYHHLEFTITWHFLRKHLPHTGCILDAGGGPGRYALELCRAGYQVVLQDISSGNLELAQTKFHDEPPEVQARLLEMVQGDVCHLSRFSSGRFDAVLCLGGVLTHISHPDQRCQALAELVRVARPGGLLALGGIGYLGVLRYMMADYSDELLLPSLPNFLQSGNVTGSTGTAWHFYRAAELRQATKAHGLHTLALVGCEGLSSSLRNATNNLAQNPDKWQNWLQVLLQTAAYPAVADMAEHILYLGRKPG